MRQPPRSLVLAAWAMSLAASCGRAAGSEADLRIEWTLHPDPPVVGPTTVDLVLADPSGRPLTGTSAHVRVEGDMSHPGMTPSLARVEEVEPGHYRAALDLTMAGDWFLLVEAGLPDGHQAHRTIRIPPVASTPRATVHAP